MLHAFRYHEDIALCQLYGRLDPVGVSKFDMEGTIEDEEKLVSVVMRVPQVLAKSVSYPHVVVVHRGHDARAVDVIERGEGVVQIRRLC